MSEIVMPRLSDTMEEGTILRWLKTDGDLVARGEELAEIETDKATMTYESDQEGVLRILAGEGTTLAVGELIATIGEADPAGAAAAAPPASEQLTPERVPAEPSPDHPASAPQAAAAEDGERVIASPLARRVARERGIDLRAVTGSGPGGRVVRADVEGPRPREPDDQAPTSVMTAKGETTDVELTRTQQTIARRMAESKATIPDFSIEIDVDMEACVALRAELKRIAHGDGEERVEAPTYNDMVVKACALALREHPRANGSYKDGRLQLHSRINVGVAVAAHGALVVPTIFDVDEKSLGEISRETRRLAGRVRDGSITPPELGGGTFTVSNLGMYGVRAFAPIVNPPQAAILAVGALQPRAVVRDETIAVRHTMTLTLVCDHRILYGADAAEMLGRVRELLEAPSSLTL
jgi:pyruvate dehydrogenase E2 component (dihydrolipoamide acetyltransferase)